MVAELVMGCLVAVLEAVGVARGAVSLAIGVAWLALEGATPVMEAARVAVGSVAEASVTEVRAEGWLVAAKTEGLKVAEAEAAAYLQAPVGEGLAVGKMVVVMVAAVRGGKAAARAGKAVVKEAVVVMVTEQAGKEAYRAKKPSLFRAGLRPPPTASGSSLQSQLVGSKARSQNRSAVQSRCP